jgi:hypothetical protein
MACSTLVFCMDCHSLHTILTHVSILKKTNHCIYIEAKDTTDTQTSASYLFLHVEINNGVRLKTKHRDSEIFVLKDIIQVLKWYIWVIVTIFMILEFWDEHICKLYKQKGPLWPWSFGSLIYNYLVVFYCYCIYVLIMEDLHKFTYKYIIWHVLP